MGSVIGLLSDRLAMKKLGMSMIIFVTVVFVSLFIGLALKKIELTYILYFFVGMSIFALLTWILCACSKIFGGRFESFSVAAQFVGSAMTFYDMAFILF